MRVLFVSKPVVPPFHDGARCLVRDVATHLGEARPTVLTTVDSPPLGGGVNEERVYARAGGFAPALSDNARVMARLLAGDAHDLWHFVFAPNAASSTAARVARAARRVPTVQTVASAPRAFEGSSRLLFGDRVVCLSAYTRDRLVAHGFDAARCEVIAPPVPTMAAPSEAERAAAMREAGLAGRGPLVVYPGDLEVSGGARAVAHATREVLDAAPGATVVFACRAKTARAAEAEAALRRELATFGDGVAFVGEVRSLPALLASSAVVVFPVDDLYGKVDLPIALLEAMALSVPVVALARGPLAELEGAVRIDDAGQLGAACARLLRDEAERQQAGAAGRAAVERRHRPADVAAAYEGVYRALLRDRGRGARWAWGAR